MLQSGRHVTQTKSLTAHALTHVQTLMNEGYTAREYNFVFPAGRTQSTQGGGRSMFASHAKVFCATD